MRGHEYFPYQGRQGLCASLSVWLVFTALQTSCSGQVEGALEPQSIRQSVSGGSGVFQAADAGQWVGRMPLQRAALHAG